MTPPKGERTRGTLASDVDVVFKNGRDKKRTQGTRLSWTKVKGQVPMVIYEIDFKIGH